MNLISIRCLFRQFFCTLPSLQKHFLIVSFLLLSSQDWGTNLSAQTKEAAKDSIDRVVTSRKQTIENQLLMRELQLLKTHAQTSKHLDLADYQTEKLTEIDRGFQKNVAEISREGALKITERAKKIQLLLDETEQQMSEVLLPDQQKRLRQIALQSFGVVSGQDVLPVLNLLGNPDFRSYFEISETTAKRLRMKMQEENQKLQQEIAKLKSQSSEAVLSILSDEEKQRISALLGEPFEFGKLSDGRDPGGNHDK